MIIPKERELWIDALRAFLAIGVLHAHSLLHLPENSVVTHSSISDFLSVFRVPAFYFISGWFVYLQMSRSNTYTYASSLIKKKFRQLLLPSIFFTLFPFFLDGIGLLLNFNTAHYFLSALFYIIMAFCVLWPFIFRLERVLINVVLLSYGIFTTVLMSIIHDIPIDGYFHWRQILHGNLFFILGVLTALNRKTTFRWLRSGWFLFLLAGGYILSYIFLRYLADSYLQGFMRTPIFRVVAPILGIYFFVGLFQKLAKYFNPDNALGKVAFFVGQRTLPLYVMQNLSFAIVFAIIDTSDMTYPNVMAIIAFVLSLLLTFLLHELICLSPVLEKYIFGREKPLAKFNDIFRRSNAANEVTF